MAGQAHDLIDQFLRQVKEEPERAWESVAELQQLLDQIREFYPARAFLKKPG